MTPEEAIDFAIWYLVVHELPENTISVTDEVAALMHFVYDDDVVSSGTATREQMAEVSAMMEKILGPIHVTCLKHGPDCPMRLFSCVIQSRHVPREA